MNTIQLLFINVLTVLSYLCILGFLLSVLIGIIALLCGAITIAWSEIKLYFNNK